MWEVAPGATIRGKLVTKSGDAVADAPIWAVSTGGAARAKTGWASDRSAQDGAYELDGIRAGAYKLQVSTERGLPPAEGYKVDVAEGAKVDKDLVLDDGGKISGTVVDETGKPRRRRRRSSRARSPRERLVLNFSRSKSDAAGNFTVEGVRPGDYRVIATLGWRDELRKPGSTDDAKQGERRHREAERDGAPVHLVVESRANSITGTVLDADGKPVSDAYLSSARESDAAGARAIGHRRYARLGLVRRRQARC